MDPEGSLPHSQVPVTCPYPEPDRSSPFLYIPLPENPSLYYPPICAWVFQVVLSLRFLRQNPCIHISSPPCTLHGPPISFFLILSPEQYWVWSTDPSVPHYVVFSTPLLPRPSLAQIGTD